MINTIDFKNVEFSDIERALVVQALRVWRGDFPQEYYPNGKPIPQKCVIWEKEITHLLNKLNLPEEKKDVCVNKCPCLNTTFDACPMVLDLRNQLAAKDAEIERLKARAKN
jgi:hypothetical protein